VNCEDPTDEIERRFAAAAKHFGITDEQIGGRLFTNSGRDHEFVIMGQVGRDFKVCEPFVDAMIAEIKANKIDVVIVDPFVSTHEVPENDNSAIQRVAKAWLQVAEKGNCSIDVIHHVVKGAEEVTADSGRGGGALKDKARSVRTINPMTQTEATKAGVDDRRDYFRLDLGKVNMAKSTRSQWRKFESVNLGNGRGLVKIGDSIGVVVPWRWPSADSLAEKAAEARAAVWQTYLPRCSPA
jgi:RecA-family ATPase